METEHYILSEVSFYGGEDCGSDYWRVFKFVDKDTKEEYYIKFQGCYSSWDGVDDWGCKLVEPKEKTIVVYEEIK